MSSAAKILAFSIAALSSSLLFLSDLFKASDASLNASMVSDGVSSPIILSFTKASCRSTSLMSSVSWSMLSVSRTPSMSLNLSPGSSIELISSERMANCSAACCGVMIPCVLICSKTIIVLDISPRTIESCSFSCFPESSPRAPTEEIVFCTCCATPCTSVRSGISSSTSIPSLPASANCACKIKGICKRSSSVAASAAS